MSYDPDRVSRLASEVADGTTDHVTSDLGHDLRFQAEVAQYKKMLRSLRSLQSEVIDPGIEVLDEILEALEEAGERHGRRMVFTARNAAYIGGIAAATAAAAGSAIVFARRRRLVA